MQKFEAARDMMSPIFRSRLEAAPVATNQSKCGIKAPVALLDTIVSMIHVFSLSNTKTCRAAKHSGRWGRDQQIQRLFVFPKNTESEGVEKSIWLRV